MTSVDILTATARQPEDICPTISALLQIRSVEVVIGDLDEFFQDRANDVDRELGVIRGLSVVLAFVFGSIIDS